VTPSAATLFVHQEQVTAEVRTALAGSVTFAPYDSILQAVAALDGVVWLDKDTCNFALITAARNRGTDAKVIDLPNPIPLQKALKTAVELQGIRNAHVRDGAALTTFFAWLEIAILRGVDARTQASVGADTMTEHGISEVLEDFRAEQPGFVSLSFATIAGSGPNGAIIHYKPHEITSAAVDPSAMLLVDSGGQYLDGTTDVTRTLHFGTPTPYEKLCYTRVLQGHIRLSAAVFPAGASGIALDAFARAPLWQSGLDYRHGTGHGVGAFLNVHEGPFGIAKEQRTSYIGGIQKSMVMSDEPGYYEEGKFGIRIENLVVAVEAPTPYRFGDTTFLTFDPLTLVPIARNLIDVALLSDAELEWLNSYHKTVRTLVGPLIAASQHGAYASEYLHRNTEPLVR
jgi:Xaa-Pro aminopeptidase